jgi:hypothetical protein
MKRTFPLAVLVGIILVSAGLAMARQQTQREPSPSAAETPSHFYMRYRAAVLKATTLDEVLAFWRTELVNEFMQAPPDQRADLSAIQRMYGMMTDVKAVDEMIGQSGGATVTLEGTRNQKKMTGTAYLVKQNGEWKLFGPERWE